MAENGRLGHKDEPKEFQKTLEFLSGLIQSFLQEIKTGEASVSVLKNEVKHLVNNFDEVSKNIKQNQKDVTEINLRLKELDNHLGDNQKDISNLIESVKSSQDKKNKQEEKEETQRTSVAVSETTGKWQFKTAIIISLLSFLATIGGNLINWIK